MGEKFEKRRQKQLSKDARSMLKCRMGGIHEVGGWKRFGDRSIRCRKCGEVIFQSPGLHTQDRNRT